MRRRILLALCLLVAGTAAPAFAQRTLVIQSFDAEIAVAADGSIVVEETIVPRFTGSWNGIFRTIPVQYRTPQGLNYTLRLDVQSVTDDEGRDLKYENSRERHYRKLKIWVPGAQDTTRTVKLRYRVANGLRFFDEHDELYWNVTGDEWEVPIESASAVVRLPDRVSGLRATAFRGAYGSTEQSAVRIGAGDVSVSTTSGLGMREGLTLVVGWNPGIVHRPTTVEKTASLVYSNVPLAIPPEGSLPFRVGASGTLPTLGVIGQEIGGQARLEFGAYDQGQSYIGTCPECSSDLQFTEGCVKCHSCGYSECG